jgi:hypothetical protein
MKIKIFNLVLFFFLTSSYSQVIKTYSGPYKIDKTIGYIRFYLLNEKATYSYFENKDSERVKTGAFNYTGSQSGNGVSLNIKVSGNYKNNFRSGVWNSVISVIDGSDYVKMITNLNYDNGQPNGLWRYDATGSLKNITSPEYTVINFDHNLTIGNFSILDYSNLIKVSGQCNKKGYLTGKIIFNTLDSGEEAIMDYEDGFLLKSIRRYKSTGNIIDKTEATLEELENFRKIQQLSAAGNTDALEELPFLIKEDYNYEMFRIFAAGFAYSCSSAFPGDKSHFDSENTYNWKGFKTKVLVEQVPKSKRLVIEAQKEKEKQENEKKDEQQKIVNDYNTIYKNLQVKLEAVTKKYSVEDIILTAATGSTVYKFKKKDILKKFAFLIDNYEIKIKESESYQEKLKLTNEAISYSDIVINLFDKNTKDLEKQIKLAETTEEIKVLLK